PLLALLLLIAIARRSVRWAVVAAGALALQVLAGHTQEVYLTLVALGIVALLAPWLAGPPAGRLAAERLPHSAFLRVAPPNTGRKPKISPRVKAAVRAGVVSLAWALGLYALVVGLGLALTAVQLLPTAELQREGIRGGGLAYGDAISFSLPPPLLLQSLLPGFWRTIFGEYVAYVGTAALCLAVLALAVAPARWAILGGLLAGVGLFLAIGGYNPLYPLLYQLMPGLNLFRVPARWLFVYSFGAALLAGWGVEWAWRVAAAKDWRRAIPWRRAAVVALAAGVAGAVLVASTPPLGAPRFYLAWAGLGALAPPLLAPALLCPTRRAPALAGGG